MTRLVPSLGFVDWIALGLVFGLSALLGFATWLTARRLLGKRGKLSPARRGVSFAGSLLLGIAVFALATEFLKLSPTALDIIHKGVGVGAVVGAAMLALALWDRSAEIVAERASAIDPAADRLLIPVARKFVRFAIFLAAGLFALSIFVPNLGAVLAGLGIGGVAVALAAKDSVENVFGSLTLLFDRPFAIGDWVRIDKVEGIVEEINLRSTRVRTFEDTIVTLPNANLIRAAVENYGARRTRRQRLVMRFAPDASAEALNGFSRDLAAWVEGRSGFVPEKTIVRLEGVTEMSIGVLIQVHLEAENYDEEMTLRDALLTEALRLRTAHGLFLAGQYRPPEPAVGAVP